MIRALLALSLCWTAVTPAAAQEAPYLSQADENAVIAWIAKSVSNARQPFCYRQSYGRGVGSPLSTCPAGHQKNGALCYPDCRAGYGGAGPVCWENCPSGYTDTGAFCTRGASSRHISIHAADCPHKFHNTGVSCYRTWPPKSESLSHSTCPAGMHRTGAYCYSECDPGYTNTGVSCYRGPDTVAKKSYGRGAGTAMGCEAGQEEDAGLCYPQCKAGFHGVGPVCWENCEAGRTACGAGCAKSGGSCAASTTNMVVAPLAMAGALFTGGATAEAEGAAKAAEEAGMYSKIVAEVKAMAKAADPVVQAANKAKPYAKAGGALWAAGSTADLWATDAIAHFDKVTTPGIAAEVERHFSGGARTWIEKEYAKQNLLLMLQRDIADTDMAAAGVASGFDPTGVSGVVTAYLNPKCSVAEPFPAFTLIRR